MFISLKPKSIFLLIFSRHQKEQKMKKILIVTILSVIFLLHACDMIEYHPYDGRISGEKDINKKNIARIEEACKGKKKLHFALISDSQRWYDETEELVKDINKRENIDFVIHAGDVSDFGVTKEFVWMRDILNKLNVPYVVLLGNHDCLANGVEIYRTIFGKENFSFLAGNTKFVCLNTNALEFDYSLPVPDFLFIEDELKDERAEFEKTVVAMHVRPFDGQFNNNVANVFQRYAKEFKNLQFCLNGHDHHLKIDDLFDDGVMYYGAPSVGKRTYFLFTINDDDSYDYEIVEY